MSKLVIPKLSFGTITVMPTAPTGVRLVAGETLSESGRFGLQVTHLIEGVYLDRKVTELVHVATHPVKEMELTYTLETEVGSNKVFTDFHHFDPSERHVIGKRVSYQLYLTGSFDVIPFSGYKITKDLYPRLFIGDSRYCAITKEPCFVNINYQSNTYSSAAGRGTAKMYFGLLG